MIGDRLHDTYVGLHSNFKWEILRQISQESSKNWMFNACNYRKVWTFMSKLQLNKSWANKPFIHIRPYVEDRMSSVFSTLYSVIDVSKTIWNAFKNIFIENYSKDYYGSHRCLFRLFTKKEFVNWSLNNKSWAVVVPTIAYIVSMNTAKLNSWKNKRI